MGLMQALARGALAGAAGTTALNAATYLDMSVRARPSSRTPQRSVAAVEERTGVSVPGEGEQRDNRISALGSLSGAAVGVGIGAVAGLLRPVLRRTPFAPWPALLGAAAMALTDVPMARLGVTEPGAWSSADWAADALPHLAYGAVTAAALRGFE